MIDLSSMDALLLIKEFWSVIFLVFIRPLGLIVKYLKSISDNLVALGKQITAIDKRLVAVETKVEYALKEDKN